MSTRCQRTTRVREYSHQANVPFVRASFPESHLLSVPVAPWPRRSSEGPTTMKLTNSRNGRDARNAAGRHRSPERQSDLVGNTQRICDPQSPVCYAHGQHPGVCFLDLAAIRSVLDLMVPIQAKVSRKRWANLRSDLSAAIAASGLRPMLKTATVELGESWTSLLDKAQDRRLRDGLSRFARWASDRQIAPQDVQRDVVDRFVTDLETASLVRKIADLGQTIVRSWNGWFGPFPKICARSPSSNEQSGRRGSRGRTCRVLSPGCR